MREDHRRHLIGRAAVLKQCGQWQCLEVLAVWLRRSRQWCPDLHAAVSAVIGRSESGPNGSVAPRGGRSANQMSPMVLAHRTTATLPIYSVLAVAAVVPPSHITHHPEVCETGIISSLNRN